MNQSKHGKTVFHASVCITHPSPGFDLKNICAFFPSIYQILPSVLPQLVFPKIGQRLHSMQVGVNYLQVLQVRRERKRKDQSLFICKSTRSPTILSKGREDIYITLKRVLQKMVLPKKHMEKCSYRTKMKSRKTGGKHLNVILLQQKIIYYKK